MLNECSTKRPPVLLEMRRDECVVDFAQRAGQLFAVLAAPLLAADQTADFAAGERDLVRYRAAVIGVLLDQRDEDLVRELTGLAERRVGPDRDALLGNGGVELDFCRCAARRASGRGRTARRRCGADCSPGRACRSATVAPSLVPFLQVAYLRIIRAAQAVQSSALWGNGSLPDGTVPWGVSWPGSLASGTPNGIECGRSSGCRAAGRPNSGVSIFCKPAIRWLVSRARSVSSPICLSLTVTWPRRNSFSPSSRAT